MSHDPHSLAFACRLSSMLIRHTFRSRLRDLRHLWDSSDDEEEQQQQQQQSSAIEVIDLSQSLPLPHEPIMCNTVSTTTTATTSNEPMASTTIEDSLTYIPRTLSANSRRSSILPAFPTSFYDEQPTLLLANVPRMFSLLAFFLYMTRFSRSSA